MRNLGTSSLKIPIIGGEECSLFYQAVKVPFSLVFPIKLLQTRKLNSELFVKEATKEPAN